MQVAGCKVASTSPSTRSGRRKRQTSRVGSASPTGHQLSTLRARQTAEAFGMPYEVDERWVELDYGNLEGMPIADVGDDVWARWRVDPTYRAGGGESMEAMRDRVISAAKEVLADANRQIVVVTSHVSPIKAAVTWALDVEVTAMWRCHLDQASVTRIGESTKGPFCWIQRAPQRQREVESPIPNRPRADDLIEHVGAFSARTDCTTGIGGRGIAQPAWPRATH